MAGHLGVWREAVRNVTPFDPSTLEAALRGCAEERGIKAAVLIHATRIAITGQGVSPSLFEVASLVGRDETAARLEALIRHLA